MSAWVLLSPPKNVERLDQHLNVAVHGWCGERRSPKVQPSTRPGIEPGTSWLAVRDLTNCANHAQQHLNWPELKGKEFQLKTIMRTIVVS